MLKGMQGSMLYCHRRSGILKDCANSRGRSKEKTDNKKGEKKKSTTPRNYGSGAQGWERSLYRHIHTEKKSLFETLRHLRKGRKPS